MAAKFNFYNISTDYSKIKYVPFCCEHEIFDTVDIQFALKNITEEILSNIESIKYYISIYDDYYKFNVDFNVDNGEPSYGEISLEDVDLNDCDININNYRSIDNMVNIYGGNPSWWTTFSALIGYNNLILGSIGAIDKDNDLDGYKFEEKLLGYDPAKLQPKLKLTILIQDKTGYIHNISHIMNISIDENHLGYNIKKMSNSNVRFVFTNKSDFKEQLDYFDVNKIYKYRLLGLSEYQKTIIKNISVSDEFYDCSTALMFKDRKLSKYFGLHSYRDYDKRTEYYLAASNLGIKNPISIDDFLQGEEFECNILPPLNSNDENYIFNVDGGLYNLSDDTKYSMNIYLENYVVYGMLNDGLMLYAPSTPLDILTDFNIGEKLTSCEINVSPDIYDLSYYTAIHGPGAYIRSTLELDYNSRNAILLSNYPFNIDVYYISYNNQRYHMEDKQMRFNLNEFDDYNYIDFKDNTTYIYSEYFDLFGPGKRPGEIKDLTKIEFDFTVTAFDNTTVSDISYINTSYIYR